MTRALRAQVTGSVTGAGFAEAVVERAREAGVLGWVREHDDALEVHLEGPDETVARLRAFLDEGPPGAEVAGVDEQPAKVEGHEQFAVRGVPAGAFVVREHAKGYDLVLEVENGLRVWTLRKSPSMRPSERRMAIEIAAASAQTDGETWDGGAYEQGGRVAWPEALERGHAMLVLHGERLRGGFALQRTRGDGSGAQWLLVKRRDEFSDIG